MMRLLAAALLVGTPVCASAQVLPSKPEAVAEAVADCWAAVGAKAIDRAVLSRSGWKAGAISNRDGNAVNTPMQPYGKTGSNVVLMLMSMAGSPTCSIVSRVTSASDISLSAQAIQRRLTAADSQVHTVRSGSSIVFLSLPKIAMLDATGTQAQPGLRVVVSAKSRDKK